MRTLLNDLRFGLRIFRKNPFTTAAVILTLGLGIGANTAVFSLVNGAFLRPFPFGDADRLLRLYEYDRARDFRMSFSYPNFRYYREHSETLQNLAAFRSASFTLSLGENPRRVSGARVSAGLFEVFGVRPIAGRTFLAEDEEPGGEQVAILNEDLWRSTFAADPEIAGKTVRIDGEPHTIVGVVSSRFKFPIDSEIWKPLALDPSADRASRNYAVVALQKADAGLDEVLAELEVLAGQLAEGFSSSNGGVGILSRSFRDSYVREARAPLLILQAAVLFVLLITCANAASLVLALGSARDREVAIRSAMGSGKWRLLRQFLTEGLLLAILGGVVGLLLTRFVVVALVAAIPEDIPYWIDVGVDTRVLIFTLAITLVCAPVFTILPALRSSRLDIREILQEAGPGSRGGRRQQRFFKLIVVAEMAVTVILLIGAGLLVKSFQRLQEVDPGFERSGLVTFHLTGPPAAKYPEEPQLVAFYDRLLDGIRGSAGVEAAGANSRLPLKGGGTETLFLAEGVVSDGRPPLANFQSVTPGYFEAMRIPLIQGRFFEARDNLEGAAGVAIVNETAARRLWPEEESVLGKRVRASPSAPWMEIVGVAGDVRHRALDRAFMLDLYRVHRQAPERRMTVAVRGSLPDPMDLGPELRRKLRETDPDVPLAELMTMDDVVARSLWLQRFGASALFAFGIVATLLAVLGFYAVVSYSVARRSQEIGVRMSLGATGKNILQMVIRESLRLVVYGIVIGLPLAVLINILLSSQLYGIGSVEIVSILTVVALLLGVGVLASLLPAIRSTRNSPALSLHYE